MTVSGWLEITLYVAVLTALTPLVGGYMARVFTGDITTLGFVERPVYRLLGVRRERGQDWKGYARSVLVFSALFFLLLYLVLRTQTLHPFNPQGLSSPTWDVSFNTAASFVSNTNWQYYAGETTLSYFSQMFGLAVQNFVSAAVGIAVAGGVHPRAGVALRQGARQLLRRRHPRRCSTSCSRSRSSAVSSCSRRASCRTSATTRPCTR